MLVDWLEKEKLQQNYDLEVFQVRWGEDLVLEGNAKDIAINIDE